MSAEKERLGIYGGAFSPIHSGHVRAAHAFLSEMKLDRLLVVPTALPPHKPAIEGASVEHRIAMAKLAFCDSAAYKSGRLQVSDFEAESGRKSYTVYTLEHFTAPQRELYLLVGTDMFLTLDKWYRAEDIFALANIVLMRRERDRDNIPRIVAKKAEYTSKFGARVHIITEPPIVISSTELREELRSMADTEGFIPEAVAKYITENGLYR